MRTVDGRTADPVARRRPAPPVPRVEPVALELSPRHEVSGARDRQPAGRRTTHRCRAPRTRRSPSPACSPATATRCVRWCGTGPATSSVSATPADPHRAGHPRRAVRERLPDHPHRLPRRGRRRPEAAGRDRPGQLGRDHRRRPRHLGDDDPSAAGDAGALLPQLLPPGPRRHQPALGGHRPRADGRRRSGGGGGRLAGQRHRRRSLRGHAVRVAPHRRRLRDRGRTGRARARDGSNTWAAYQCYGVPGFRLHTGAAPERRAAAATADDRRAPPPRHDLHGDGGRHQPARSESPLRALVSELVDELDVLAAAAESHPSWSTPEICEALGAAYADLGSAEQGMRWYRKATEGGTPQERPPAELARAAGQPRGPVRAAARTRSRRRARRRRPPRAVR